MLETIALIIGLAVIFAIVVGAGLFSMLILGGIFFVILFLTKAIFLAVIVLLVLASPFLALGLLTKLCQDRTVPGTQISLSKAITIGGILLVLLGIYSVGHSLNGVDDFMGNMRSMMEQCDKDGDHSSDMILGDRHYHFSCRNGKTATPGQNM